jgi:SAM-dependent methyltransferase
MHGAVIDWVVINTVENAYELQTGGTPDTELVKEHTYFKKKALTHQPRFQKILEIGSLDIIGSMPTYNFMNRGRRWIDIVSEQKNYTGIDIMPGKNVDIVMNAHDLKFPDNTFDLVMCLQMLEHDDQPAQTVKEAYRVLQPGCPLILTCAEKNHPEHADLGGGSRHYEFISTEQMEKYLRDAGFTDFDLVMPDNNFYIYAIK